MGALSTPTSPESIAGWRNECNADRPGNPRQRRRRRGGQVRGHGRRMVGSGRQVQAAAHAEPLPPRLHRRPDRRRVRPRPQGARAPSPACASSTSAAAAACSPSPWRASAPRWWASTPPPATSRSPACTPPSPSSRSTTATAPPRTSPPPARAFDVVLNMEVVEHVADPPAFLAACRDLLRPGGLMICSTINRNPKSWLLAIVGAEHVMRWLPRGTHDWSKFITPDELSAPPPRRRPRPGRRQGLRLQPPRLELVASPTATSRSTTSPPASAPPTPVDAVKDSLTNPLAPRPSRR